MARVEIGRRITPTSLLIVVLELTLALALPARARAQSTPGVVCPRVPAGLRCAPLPKDGWLRREAMQTLDAEGRRRVARGDYAGAAQAFGCLVEGDATPESAGNLAVVLREQGDLGGALLVARCAEDLAAPGPLRDRARARREEIEHRLGLPSSGAPDNAHRDAVMTAVEPAGAPAARTGSQASDPPSRALDLRAPPPEPAPHSYHRTAYVPLGAGAAALIAGGVLYALARDRAHQFDQEQQTNGYTDRARTLRSEAQNLEVASWITGGAGVLAAAAGGVLLTF
jgi:hypothetical protein